MPIDSAGLRRFLRQRRELGEHEVVLDHLRRPEALALLESAPAVPATSPPARRDAANVRRRKEGDVAAGGLRGTVSRQPELADVAPSDGPPSASLESLADVAGAVAACTLCPLHASAKNPVPGEGNPDAEMMFVGEAPGQSEDDTGRPFVGAAGQVLTRIIEALGLRREDVFICNVLKHRPPGNRNPLPEEVRVCSPYLRRQIELVRPRVIVALGTFAAQTLLETATSLGKLRGTVHRYHGVPLVVTYHPAALLRNPSWKRPTWEDVQLARRILESSGSDA